MKGRRGRTDFDAYGGSEANSSSATIEDKTKIKNLTVDIEEYNRVREELIKLENDYGKLVWARDHLETKVREQKESLRQWKEYRKSWILKHPNKQLSHLRPSFTRPSPPTSTENCRSSSAPAPPAFPEGLTPSLGGFSKSPSRHNAQATPKDIEYWHHHEVCPDNGDRDQTLDEAGILQIGRRNANVSDSGDVTEADPECERPAESIKFEPATGGSSPIIIFERSLKRRHSARDGAQNKRVHVDDQRHMGPNSRTDPPKDEQISSPIPATPLLHLNGPNDSLDLDDVGGHVDTPRKRQRLAEERLRSSLKVHSPAVQDAENMLDDMTAAECPRHVDNEQPAMDGEGKKQASEPIERNRTQFEKTTEAEKKARRDERIARQHAHNDRVHQRLEAAERGGLIIDPPRTSFPSTTDLAQQPHMPREIRQDKPHLDSPVILQPRTVNTIVLPRTSDPFLNQKRPCPPSRRDRGAAHVPVLAEDGENLSSKIEALKARKKSKDDQNDPYGFHGPADKGSKAPPTHHRLGALLTKPSPEKSLLISEEPVADVSTEQAGTKTPVSRTVYQRRSKDPATPRSLPATKSELNRGPGHQFGPADLEPFDAAMDKFSKSVQPVTRRTKNVTVFRKPPLVDSSETQPEHEPFRARPLHCLSLQNFKLNPAHSTYAYHDTVRKHDEKKLLSGCTDRHCPRCKDLRKYVMSSGYKTAQKPGESQDDADTRLMQDFLGDNHRQLKSMSKKEKSDLLVEAKVREFANRFGCHRQAFSRPRDAPGTWEVDFPTTQQDAEDRAEAEVMEREKVQERYWEAMREGGKWIFADE